MSSPYTIFYLLLGDCSRAQPFGLLRRPADAKQLGVMPADGDEDGMRFPMPGTLLSFGPFGNCAICRHEDAGGKLLDKKSRHAIP